MKRIDILAASELKSIMMKPDIAGAMLVLQALLIGGTDPEPGLAIRPADRVVIFIRDLKAEVSEEPVIEGFRFLIVTDPDDDMVYSYDLDHPALLSQLTTNELSHALVGEFLFRFFILAEMR